MAIIRNPYAASAAIARGFDNVADIFKPPSAGDVYAYAKAGETRQKAARAEDLYNYAKDPNFDKTQFDRRGMASGAWSPNQSFYAVDQADGTKRYGIGVESSDRRYSTDVGAATQRYGIDVGSKDLRYKTDADNKRAIDQTTITDKGNTTRALIAPVGKDQVRYNPPDVASMYGVDPQQYGIVEVKPGEKNVLPDGRTFEGAPVPKTRAQVEGDILAGMTPDERAAVAFGNTPVETVREPGTGQTRTVTRPQQLAQNLPSVPDKASQVFNYKAPDGRGGTAVYDPISGGLVDSQTRAPLPAGSQVQNPSGVQNDKGLGGATTANQTKSNDSAAQDTIALDQLDLLEGLVRNNPGVLGIVGSIRGTAQDAVASAQDLARTFGDKAPQIKAAADQMRAGMQGVAPEMFDPAIPQARFLQATIAYGIARTENPGGEVSRQAFERAMERVGGGMLSNSQQVLAQLAAYRDVIKAKQAGNAALGGRGAPRTDTSFQGGATRPRAVDANGNTVEWDGATWAPVK